MNNCYYLGRAIELATNHYKDEWFKSQPYIHHVLRVMVRMHRPEEKILAVLKDIIKPHRIPLVSHLRKEEFSPFIMDSLDTITRHPEEKYEIYLDRVVEDTLALLVTIEDMQDKIMNIGYNAVDKDQWRVRKFTEHIGRLKRIANQRLVKENLPCRY